MKWFKMKIGAVNRVFHFSAEPHPPAVLLLRRELVYRTHTNGILFNISGQVHNVGRKHNWVPFSAGEGLGMRLNLFILPSKRNMKLDFSFVLFSILLFSCGPLSDTTSSKGKNSMPLPSTVFYADVGNNGIYEVMELEKEERPQPVQGSDQWIRDFFGSLNYPASARKKGISGIVLLNVEVDEFGKVTNVSIKESLYKDCDAESIRAYQESTKNGFTPFLHNNIPTKFKMDVPVKFTLH